MQIHALRHWISVNQYGHDVVSAGYSHWRAHVVAIPLAMCGAKHNYTPIQDLLDRSKGRNFVHVGPAVR